jgi:hypothetical protein
MACRGTALLYFTFTNGLYIKNKNPQKYKMNCNKTAEGIVTVWLGTGALLHLQNIITNKNI